MTKITWNYDRQGYKKGVKNVELPAIEYERVGEIVKLVNKREKTSGSEKRKATLKIQTLIEELNDTASNHYRYNKRWHTDRDYTFRVYADGTEVYLSNYGGRNYVQA